MSATRSSQLPQLPLELWEKAILDLPTREILGLRLLNRLSRDIVDHSPAIQYRFDLLSARLEEGAVDDSMPLEDRRKLLQAYTSRWDGRHRGEPWLLPVSNTWQDVSHYDQRGESWPVVELHTWQDIRHDHIICAEASVVGADMKDVRIVRLPSLSLGVPTKEWEWNIVGVPGWPLEIHPPSNLLVASQITDEETSFRLSLLQLSDGCPHPDASEPIIIGTKFGNGPLERTIDKISAQATGCRLAVKVSLYYVPVRLGGTYDNLFIWDWRTGQKYLDYIYPPIEPMYFIDDFRLLGVVHHLNVNFGKVMLWDSAVLGDTRIPRQLVFDLGSQYKVMGSWHSRDGVICDLESNYKTPFRTDPSMRLVGIKVYRGAWTSPYSSVLLIRSQVLSGFASKIGTTSVIKWEDWSQFAKSVPIRGLQNANLHLLHSHLVCLHRSKTLSASHLHVFNFSLEYKRREGDSGAIGEFSQQVIPVSEEFLDSVPYFSTSNIIFKSSIAYAPSRELLSLQVYTV